MTPEPAAPTGELPPEITAARRIVGEKVVCAHIDCYGCDPANPRGFWCEGQPRIALKSLLSTLSGPPAGEAAPPEPDFAKARAAVQRFASLWEQYDFPAIQTVRATLDQAEKEIARLRLSRDGWAADFRTLEAELARLRSSPPEEQTPAFSPEEREAVRRFFDYGATRGNHEDAFPGPDLPGPLSPYVLAMQSVRDKVLAAPAPKRTDEPGE